MKRAHCLQRAIVVGAAGLLLICIAGAGCSALSNRTLPTRPTILDRLDPLDKARLEETLHLKQDLGETVWPGWGQADIPIILWNNEYAFLIGLAEPPADWEHVPDDDFKGQPYYRQPVDDPQNFATLVGQRWVASLATKAEMDQFLIEQFHQMLPGPLKVVFPYRLLIQPSEVQMTGVLHETFHVYQISVAPERLAAAEAAHQLEDQYWPIDETMRPAWQTEINLLVQAVRATSVDEAQEFARQFLDQRETRRQSYPLGVDLINYERQLEWEEGLAKYVELSIWQAATTATYTPLSMWPDDADFKYYRTFSQRWSQELDQLKRQAGQEGEVRFYYTGMAQAFLLDRLLPDWKARILTEPITLEELLLETLR